jgi:hypothetical protein
MFCPRSPSSSHAPAQRAIAQRFRALARTDDYAMSALTVAIWGKPDQICSMCRFPALAIATQFSDVAPGATSAAYGNWNQTYTVVNRKPVTMLQDPYSAGFCILYKFETRIGGGITCPNAARLLRVR